jgi:hypothetical protein
MYHILIIAGQKTSALSIQDDYGLKGIEGIAILARSWIDAGHCLRERKVESVSEL